MKYSDYIRFEPRRTIVTQPVGVEPPRRVVIPARTVEPYLSIAHNIRPSSFSHSLYNLDTMLDLIEEYENELAAGTPSLATLSKAEYERAKRVIPLQLEINEGAFLRRMEGRLEPNAYRIPFMDPRIVRYKAASEGFVPVRANRAARKITGLIRRAGQRKAARETIDARTRLPLNIAKQISEYL